MRSQASIPPTYDGCYSRRVTKIVVVCGPTATGKTALSVALAREFGGEIVNADSTQVYRGLDLGTAKPTTQERGGVPHHLFDVRDPDEPLSAYEWAKLADAAIEQIHARGKLPIVVGGTGFYLRALLEGLFEAPAVDPDVKARIVEEGATPEGLATLYARLQQVDPITAREVKPRDRFRILRALEVFETSGTPISEFRRRHAETKSGPRYDALVLGLDLPRDLLYERIDARQAAQVKAGLLDEYRALLTKGFSADLRTLNGLCYRHMRWVHEGKMSLEEAVRLDQRDNRRYAKRQLTWFRAMPGIRWFDARTEETKLYDAVRKFVGAKQM